MFYHINNIPYSVDLIPLTKVRPSDTHKYFILFHTELKQMQTSEDPKTQDASKGLLMQLGLLDIHEEPPVEQRIQDELAEGEQHSIEEHPCDTHPTYQEVVHAPPVEIRYNWEHFA